MPLIVPSQIVQYIRDVFPSFGDIPNHPTQILTLNTDVRGAVLGLASLIDSVPPHLIRPELFPEIVMGKEAIRSCA